MENRGQKKRSALSSTPAGASIQRIIRFATLTCATPLLLGSYFPALAVPIKFLSADGWPGSYAYKISNSGVVAGYLDCCGGSYSAATWSGDSVTRLGFNFANGINDNGTIVGQTNHAVIWSNGTIRDIGTFGGRSSVAYGINNVGQVVGAADTASGSPRAFVYSNGVMQNLGDYNQGNWSVAFDINDAGLIAGSAYKGFGGERRAVVWAGGRMLYDLGPGMAYAINNSNTVVGRLNGSNHSLNAFVSIGGIAKELAPLPFLSDCVANDINGFGAIVGTCESDIRMRAVMWAGGAPINLNDLLDPEVARSGWVLETAQGINDLGQVVGYASNSTTDSRRGYVLSVASSVPEASTTLTSTIGLIFMFFLTRGRVFQEYSRSVLRRRSSPFHS